MTTTAEMKCHITLFLSLFFKRSTIFTVHINYLRFGCHWENNVLTLVKELLTDGQVQIFNKVVHHFPSQQTC